MTVAALARGLSAALLLLPALLLTCVRPTWSTKLIPEEGKQVTGDSTWTALFEETGTSSRSYWLLPTGRTPSTVLSSGLPEYYGATVHPVIRTWSQENDKETSIMVTLRASVALRDNMASVFGYFLYLPENDLGDELYPALSVLHELIRLRRIELAELVLAVPEMANIPPGKQCQVLFNRMSQVVPRYAKSAVEVWIQALKSDELNTRIDRVMRPEGGPLIVDFLNGFDQPTVKWLSSYVLESDDVNETLECKDTFILNALNALRSGEIKPSQPLFGMILFLRPRNIILPDREESERHLVDSLMHNKLRGWDRVTWHFKNADLESPNNLITNIVYTLLSQSDLEPQIQDELQKVIESIEVSKHTFMNAYFDQLSTILNEPSLDVLKLLEIIVPGEYPEEIVDLRWRVEHYIRNGFIDVELALRGFNRFDYATPQDILVGILVRIQKYFRNLPHEIMSSVSHLKCYITFKTSRAKLRRIENTDIVDMLHAFESYHVPDNVVAASLKIKSYLQIENIDWMKVLQYINAENCGQPRPCILNVFTEALSLNLLKGRKCKPLIENFLRLLNENGDPYHLQKISYNDRNGRKGQQEMIFLNCDNLYEQQKLNSCEDEEDDGVYKTVPQTKDHAQKETNKEHKSRPVTKTSTEKVLDIANVEISMPSKIKTNTSKNKRRPLSSKLNSKISNNPSKGVETQKRIDGSSISPSPIYFSIPNFSTLSTHANYKKKTLHFQNNPPNTTSIASFSVISSPEIKISTQITSKSVLQSSTEINPRNKLRGEYTSISKVTNSEKLISDSDETIEEEEDLSNIDSIERQKRDAVYHSNESTEGLSNTENFTKDTTKRNETNIQNSNTNRSGLGWDSTIAPEIPLVPIHDSEQNSPDAQYAEPSIKLETSTKTDDSRRRNKSKKPRLQSRQSPGRFKVLTKEWSKKRERKHRHYKQGPLVGHKTDEDLDPHIMGFDSDPDNTHYRPLKLLLGRKPIRYRLVKLKRYKVVRQKRRRYHDRGKHHNFQNNIGRLNRRDMEDNVPIFVVADSYEMDNDGEDYPNEEYVIYDNDDNAGIEPCEEENTDCHGDFHPSEDENYHNEDEPHRGSRDEDYYFEEGIKGYRGSRRNNLDIMPPTPVPYRNNILPFRLSLVHQGHYGPLNVVTREWSKKRRRQHKHIKHGLRPVGFTSEDDHKPDFGNGENVSDKESISLTELPLLYGRKPIGYRLVKYKRNKIIRSKRVRQRKVKIPINYFRRSYFQDVPVDYFKNTFGNKTRRINTFDPFYVVQYNNYPNDESAEDSDEEEDDFDEICEDRNEDYLECIKNYQVPTVSKYYYYPIYGYSGRPQRARSMSIDPEPESLYDEIENENNEHDYDVEFDDNEFSNDYGDAYMPHRRLLSFSNFKSDIINESSQWKRRLKNGWKPPKFTNICPKKEQQNLVCEEKSTMTGIIYSGSSEVGWNGTWMYPPDILQLAYRMSQSSAEHLINTVHNLNLRGIHHTNKSLTFINLNQATSVEVLLEVLALLYKQEVEQRSGDESPSQLGLTTSAGTAIPSRPKMVGFHPPFELFSLDVGMIQRLLEPASSASLPVPDESVELEPANCERLDTLLPFTVPGTLSDVKMRPLRILLGLPEVFSLLDEGSAEEFVPAWGVRKGPLLREVLHRAAKSTMVKQDPLLKQVVENFMARWDARRRSRPRSVIDVASLMDALPLTAMIEGHTKADSKGSVSAREASLAAAREFLTQPKRRPAAMAALGPVTQVDVTKGQLLRRLLRRAKDRLPRKDKALAEALREASQMVLLDGLGAQAPMRTLPLPEDGYAAISIEVRALFRDALNPQRVTNDDRAIAALKELLRWGTARSFDAAGVFRGFDASPHRTRADLLTAVLRHLTRAGPSTRVKSAARTLLPFVEENGVLVGAEIDDGLPGHGRDGEVKIVGKHGKDMRNKNMRRVKLLGRRRKSRSRNNNVSKSSAEN